ncbi:hypothetical protein C0989_007386 [Termitomyces sp. Mn162]|nr:hypothetical protein C0989_007386 [Termitomyces sp. Mn162]
MVKQSTQMLKRWALTPEEVLHTEVKHARAHLSSEAPTRVDALVLPQQAMGPADTYDVLSTKLTILKLEANGSNWPAYQERVTNAIMSKKLCHHLMSTVHKPAELVEHDGFFYQGTNLLVPMSDMEVEDYEKLIEEWLQKGAQVHKIIYSMVDQSTFHQVKGETIATTVWKKLALIHGNKDAMYETDLLAQLQNSCFVKNSEVDMHTDVLLCHLVLCRKPKKRT